MKYLSLDIETTGLHPAQDQILQFGAIIEDTNDVKFYDKLPKFEFVFLHDRITGSPFAINMTQAIIRHSAAGVPMTDITPCHTSIHGYPNEFIPMFTGWLASNGLGADKINVAGKNVAGFDLLFLKQIPGWSDIKIRHRVIDPAVLYVKWNEDDSTPDLSTCLSRAGFAPEVAHDALEDAWDVIRVLRRFYEK